MRRGILGIVAGVVAGGAVILLVEGLGMRVYPPPAGLDLKNPESIRTFMKNAPVGALLFVLAAHAAGGLAGGSLAALAGRALWPGIATGAILMVLALLNLLAVPHPAWFWAASLVLPVPLAWAGAVMVRSRARSRASVPRVPA